MVSVLYGRIRTVVLIITDVIQMFLLSILSKSYNIIIDHGISAPGHRRKVVDGLIDTEKRSTFNTIVTVQVPVSKRFDTRMALHTSTQNTDVSLALVKCITKIWYYR